MLKYMLWKLFTLNRSTALKLWLAIEFELHDMPTVMLFFGNAVGLIPNIFIMERIEHSHDDIFFLPEQMAKRKDESDIYSTELLEAIRTVRTYYVVRADKVHSSDQRMSRQVRCQAAILLDDDAMLGQIAAEPDFQFTAEQLAFAARYGSIRCFRFLSINNAAYNQTTLEAAVYGGCEEIIQMRLEHECDPRTANVMTGSVRGCQTKVVEWLINVHQIQPSPDDVAVAVLSGSFSVLVHIYTFLFGAEEIKFVWPHHDILPPNSDVRRFVDYLLTEPQIHESLQSKLMKDALTVVYCDDVDLMRQCKFEVDWVGSRLFVTPTDTLILLEPMPHIGVSVSCINLLMFAARHRCHNLLNHLPDKVIDAIWRNENTTLIYCIQHGEWECTVQLLEHGANVEASGYSEWTPLIHAADDGSPTMIRLLVQHGANLETTDDVGLTALAHAARCDNIEAVIQLIELGANVQAADGDGSTVLMTAVRYGFMDVVRILVEHGASVNAADIDGLTALMISAMNSAELTRTLVEDGADVNAADLTGKTPLMYAASINRVAQIKLLIEHGANVNATTKDGLTALSFMELSKGHNAVKYLTEQIEEQNRPCT